MHANAIMRAFEAMMHEVPKRSANPIRRYARWDRVRMCQVVLPLVIHTPRDMQATERR